MALNSGFIHECSEKFAFILLQDRRSHNSVIFSFTFCLSLKGFFKLFFFCLGPLHCITFLGFLQKYYFCAPNSSHINITKSICPVHTIEHESLAEALLKTDYHFGIFHPMQFFMRFLPMQFGNWKSTHFLCYCIP